MIYSKQFGFRSNHSTNHAIISNTEHIRNLLDNGQYVCGIFVDLEKAFDTVNHTVLCEKLNFYGLRGNVNNLLKSYLSNRKQYVSLKGFDSEVRDITCGVPQGSSLGPLFFLLYINETIVNTELKQVVKWLRLNRLSLNAGKTELIFFHSMRRTLNYDNLSIKLNGVKLTPVDHVKYLGMYQ